jgi:uncharacterized membrane protein YbhN (UPF0104 family)
MRGGVGGGRVLGMPTVASHPTALPGRIRAAASAKVASAVDALLAHAQPSSEAAEALTAPEPSGLPRPSSRQLALGAVGVVALAALLALGVGPAAELTEALERAASADLGWAAAGVGFEAASFAGYIVLFWLIAGRATPAIGLRESAEVTFAGAAATRLLPTAGIGGIALTLWALARSGLEARAAVRALLTFNVLLYAVFMGALATAGVVLAAGVAPGDGPVALAAIPALFGAGVIVAALAARRAGSLLGTSVHGAVAALRSADPRLLGALAWWGFDLAVLAATFQALGAGPPIAVLVLAYFTGAIANTIPLPGLVSGGTIGILLAFGVDASAALPAVLAYRAIALWLPATLGTIAVAGLRRTAARWAEQPVLAAA